VKIIIFRYSVQPRGVKDEGIYYERVSELSGRIKITIYMTSPYPYFDLSVVVVA